MPNLVKCKKNLDWKWFFFAHNVFVEGQTCQFNVIEESFCNEWTKHINLEVCFILDNLDIVCTGLLFEFRGILCWHYLVVLEQEKVAEVLMKYVLTKWSKNLRRKHTYIRDSYGTNGNDPQIDRYDRLWKKFYDIDELASGSTNAIDLLHKHVDAFLDKHRDHQQISTIVPKQYCLALLHHQCHLMIWLWTLTWKFVALSLLKERDDHGIMKEVMDWERSRVKNLSGTHQVVITRNSISVMPNFV